MRESAVTYEMEAEFDHSQKRSALSRIGGLLLAALMVGPGCASHGDRPLSSQDVLAAKAMTSQMPAPSGFHLAAECPPDDSPTFCIASDQQVSQARLEEVTRELGVNIGHEECTQFHGKHSSDVFCSGDGRLSGYMVVFVLSAQDFADLAGARSTAWYAVVRKGT